MPTATVPDTFPALPKILPTIGFVTVKLVKVPTDVKDEPTTVFFKEVPVNVVASAVTVIFAEPSNATSLMVFVAANLVDVAALPVMLPEIGFVTVKSVNVPTDVKEEPTTVLFKEVPVNVVASAVTVIFAEPSNATSLMVFVAANLVAVDALPVIAALMFLALKSPLASRATIVDTVFASVAVVAELLTFPAVVIVANLVSAIDAEVEISALTISPFTILLLVMELSAKSAVTMVSSAIFVLVIAPVAMDGEAAFPVRSPAN